MFPTTPSTSSPAHSPKRGHSFFYGKLSTVEGISCVHADHSLSFNHTTRVFDLDAESRSECRQVHEEEVVDDASAVVDVEEEAEAETAADAQIVVMEEDTKEEEEEKEKDEEALRRAEKDALQAVLRELQTGTALLVVPRGRRPKFHWVQLSEERDTILIFDKKRKLPRCVLVSQVSGVCVAQPPQVEAIGSPYLGSVSLQIVYFAEVKRGASLERRELFFLCKSQRERDSWLAGLRYLTPLRGGDRTDNGCGLALPEEEPPLDAQVDERHVVHARDTIEELFQAFQRLKSAVQNPRLPEHVKAWVPGALERVKQQIMQAECHVDNAYVLRADAWRVQITVQCLLEKIGLVLSESRPRLRRPRFW